MAVSSRFFSRVALTVVAAGLVAGAAVAPRSAEAQRDANDIRVQAPELPENLKFLNSPPLTMEKLRGKVVLIDFWEYTCVNCIRTFPYLKAWNEKYKDKGLVILGVHTPEFDFAKAQPNVQKAIKDFGLDYPHILDSDYAVWNTYGNRYWPAKYLIDANGFVRYFHFGEGSYGKSEAKIQELLKEANPKVELPAITEPIRGTDKPGAVCYPVTPELYLGFQRGGPAQTLANAEGYKPGQIVAYKDPGAWEDGLVYASGPWKNTGEALISTRPNTAGRDYIAIKYHAIEVNSVIRPESGETVKVWVHHDGKPVAKQDKGDDIKYDAQGKSYLEINEPKMYSILKNAKFGQHTLKLTPAGANVGIYSYTFVSCEVPKKGK